jgi:hypothetical protein
MHFSMVRTRSFKFPMINQEQQLSSDLDTNISRLWLRAAISG